MRRLCAIPLVLLFFPIHLATMEVNATPAKYAMMGIEISNGATFHGPGPFSIRPSIRKGGYYLIYIYDENGDQCGIPLQKLPMDPIKAYYRSVLEDCWIGGGKPTLFKVMFLPAKSSSQVGDAYVYINIMECIYSPAQGLEVTGVPDTLTFDEGVQDPVLNVTLENTGTATVNNASLITTFGTVEGPGNITLTYVTGETIPQNIRLPAIPPGGERTYYFHFHLDPKGPYYTRFQTDFSLGFESTFTYDANESNSSVEVYDYLPGGGWASQSHRVTMKLGEKFALAGNPNLEITMIQTKLTALPNESVQFTFSVRNRGDGKAFNVDIWVETKPPDAKLTFLVPADLGSSIGGITHPIILQYGNGTRAPLDPNSQTSDIKFVLNPPEYLTVGSSVYEIIVTAEWNDMAGRHFEANETKFLSIREPGEPSVVITKQVSPNLVCKNGTLTVTLKVDNLGSGVASNIRVTDEYPTEYFTLTGGQTSFSKSSLQPEATETFSYVLKATREGSVPFTAANVLFVDERGVQRAAQSNPVGIVRVVMPDVRCELTERPPDFTTVGSLVTYKLSIHNAGTGAARNVELVLNTPPALELVKVEGGEIRSPGKIRVQMEELDPDETRILSLELRPLATGRFNLTPVKAEYLSTDGSSSLQIGGLEEVEFGAMVSRAVRILLTTVLFSTMGMVCVFVAYLTVGFSFGRRSPRLRRRGLG